MRLTFLLDENVLYQAIRGVDKFDNPDTTAADLLSAIGRICHVIFVHQELINRYQKSLKKLHEDPPRSAKAMNFVKQFLFNSLKRVIEYPELPELPQGVQVPHEDEVIVQVALICKPVVVTNDSRLEDAINNHHEKLGLKALDARAALELAESEKP